MGRLGPREVCYKEWCPLSRLANLLEINNWGLDGTSTPASKQLIVKNSVSNSFREIRTSSRLSIGWLIFVELGVELV